MDEYVPHRKVKEILGISDSTVRRWANQGLIPYIWSPNHQRMYSKNGLLQMQLDQLNKSFKLQTNSKKINSKTSETSRKGAIYVRVSSSKQKDDLERQTNFLLDQYPDYEVFKDIGSGINFKRKGLLSLLKHSRKGHITEVVVASKDRLSRIAFELIEWVLLQDSTRIVVFKQHHGSAYAPENTELGEDLLGIVQVFCC
jgi:predicted site-specific integrase-resolvase